MHEKSTSWASASAGRHSRYRFGTVAAVLCGAVVTGALGWPSIPDSNIGDLSIEELMNETITSVSLREQKLADAASAISLINRDGVERAGAIHIWDALRTVPGVQVGAQYSGVPTVSARGFNGVFSNKLLVLVDGRPVYTPLFGGVYWYLQQPFLADLDRVEIIKGPGSSTWGANAMNGVINIESQSARETIGTFLAVDGGEYHRWGFAARQGWALGAATYGRVWISHDDERSYPNPVIGRDPDWNNWHVGARVDQYRGADTQLSLLTGFTDVDAGDYAQASNFNALARWTRGDGENDGWQLQAFYDRNEVLQPELMGLATDTLDVSFKQIVRSGDRYALTWGGGARELHDHFQQVSEVLLLEQLSERNHVYNLFAQQEWDLVPSRWNLTFGLKLEHNSLTQLEFQPSVRTSYRFSEAHRAWAAVSRAVRSPSEFEGTRLGAVAFGPPFQAADGNLYVPRAIGDTGVKSEVLWAYEAGYRFIPARRWSLDIAAFSNRYAGLIASQQLVLRPAVPVGVAEVRAGNAYDARSHGGEIAATFDVTARCRVVAGYSHLALTLLREPGANLALVSALAPRHQAHLRAACNLGPRGNLDVQVRYVGAVDEIPGYVTTDVRLAWRLQPDLELSLVGENLTNPGHREVPSSPIFPSSEIPARVRARVAWRF